MNKVIKWVGIVLLSCYVIGCASLYLLQEKILFRPQPIPKNTQFRFGSEVFIPVDDHTKLHGLYHKIDQPKGVVLYLHGNRGNARRCQRQAEMFEGYGYNVFLLDYRGYGKSSGTIGSNRQLYDDVQKVYDYLNREFDESQIILVGYSLGTGMASHLAAKNNPKHLLLIAPYISIVDMKDRFAPFIPDFLVKYPLNNKEHISEAKCPITIFHGTEDEVIPYDSSEDLKKVFADKIDLVTLTNTSHRGSIFHGAIRSAMGRIQ